MKRLFLPLLFLLPGLLPAQVRDVQTRTGLQLNLNLPKKFTASAAVQFRTENNLSQINQIWGQVEVSRSFFKFLTLDAGYRYKWRPDINTQRFYSDVSVSHSIDLDFIGLKKYKLQASLRLKVQNEVENIPPAEWTLRPRVKFALERKKWNFTPWIAWEEYYTRRIYGWDQARIRGFVGVEFNLPKRFELNVFYAWQLQRYTANPVQTNIFGAILSYGLKIKSGGKSNADPTEE